MDLGCSFGLFSIWLALRKARVVGVDLNKGAVYYARNLARKLNLKCYFVIADACHLPFNANIFDRIICLDVLEHIDQHDLVIQEIAGVLKQNGALILTTPSNIWKFPISISEKFKGILGMPSEKLLLSSFHHVRRGYSYQNLKELFHVHGLKIVKHFYFFRKISGLGYDVEFTPKLTMFRLLLFPLFYFLLMLDDFLLSESTVGSHIAVKVIRA